MRKIKSALPFVLITLSTALIASAIIAGLYEPDFVPIIAGWGDSSGGRPSYTEAQINDGVLGDKIVFNSINNSVIGDEKNFVAAIEYEEGKDYAGVEAQANAIKVENGKEYLIRLYVHNNNPSGENAIAKNTKVAFGVPTISGKQVQVNGYIYSDNADPKEYWDGIRFWSDDAFHLEYIYGSALLANNGIGDGNGVALSDDIVQKQGGVLIGYNALDGRVPGCYQYANYVSIRVKAVFDTDFYVDKQVRLEGTKEWSNHVNAKVGDRVEFQIEYKNTGKKGDLHENVMIRDVLPKNLRYVANTTRIWNINHTGDAVIPDGDIIGRGINIGSYDPGANAFIRFTAEVVDEDLACGSNTLVNWGRGTVGDTVLQDYASVIIQKE